MKSAAGPWPLIGSLGIATGLALATLAWIASANAQALVVDGETIAGAELVQAAKAEGELLVYTANFEDSERPLLELFRRDTGIKSQMIRLATGRLFERVMTEFSGKRLRADVVGLTDVELASGLVDAGVLVPYRIANWDAIAAELKDVHGHYYAMNRFPVVLGYNTKAWTKATAPKSWVETLDPRFKDQVGVVQASAGGSSWSVALFQRTKVDPRFWEKQAANAPRIYTSSGPMAEDIVRGEITVGTVQMGLVKNLLRAGAPISLHFPSEGAPTVATVVGVTSVARHPNAAKLYLNWVTSKRGGKAITDIFADYASHPRVAPPDLSQYSIDVPPAKALWIADPAESRAKRDKWIPEWDQIYRARKVQ